MAIKYDANTSAIKNKLWPLVKTALDKESVRRKYKVLLNDFISHRSDDLYDNIPCSRLVCSDVDMDKMFEVLSIPKNTVAAIIKETYYGNIQNFTPLSAKHEFTVVMMCVI